jgi:hypothetical protein
MTSNAIVGKGLISQYTHEKLPEHMADIIMQESIERGCS